MTYARPPANMEMPICVVFRNGTSRKDTVGRKWRWGPWSGPWAKLGQSDYDIVDWWPMNAPK